MGAILGMTGTAALLHQTAGVFDLMWQMIVGATVAVLAFGDNGGWARGNAPSWETSLPSWSSWTWGTVGACLLPVVVEAVAPIGDLGNSVLSAIWGLAMGAPLGGVAMLLRERRREVQMQRWRRETAPYRDTQYGPTRGASRDTRRGQETSPGEEVSPGREVSAEQEASRNASDATGGTDPTGGTDSTGGTGPKKKTDRPVPDWGIPPLRPAVLSSTGRAAARSWTEASGTAIRKAIQTAKERSTEM
jgi:hypothetical protein